MQQTPHRSGDRFTFSGKQWTFEFDLKVHCLQKIYLNNKKLFYIYQNKMILFSMMHICFIPNNEIYIYTKTLKTVLQRVYKMLPHLETLHTIKIQQLVIVFAFSLHY